MLDAAFALDEVVLRIDIRTADALPRVSIWGGDNSGPTSELIVLDTPAFPLGIVGWISSNTPPSGPHASHVGYNFNGSPSNFMNKYSVRGTPAGGCPADLDGDGDADVNDFFLYLDLFASGDPLADITGDGVIDINDFFAYLDLFEQGCP